MGTTEPKKVRVKIQLYKGAIPEYKIYNVKYVGLYAEFTDSKGKSTGSIRKKDLLECITKTGVWKRYGTSAVSFKRY